MGFPAPPEACAFQRHKPSALWHRTIHRHATFDGFQHFVADILFGLGTLVGDTGSFRQPDGACQTDAAMRGGLATRHAALDGFQHFVADIVAELTFTHFNGGCECFDLLLGPTPEPNALQSRLRQRLGCLPQIHLRDGADKGRRVCERRRKLECGLRGYPPRRNTNVLRNPTVDVRLRVCQFFR